VDHGIETSVTDPARVGEEVANGHDGSTGTMAPRRHKLDIAGVTSNGDLSLPAEADGLIV
jgi:hypothetical protein